MAPNPNPARITHELWSLWDYIDRKVPSMKLGGIYAAKTGYHDIRAAISSRDYSVAEVAGDRRGPADKAAAIDLTPATAQDMIVYTARMDRAAKAKDPRLFIGGVPVIREFIGTLNGRTPYCYVLTGGRARGLPADASEDWGRDASHLWHLHISIIREFVTNQRAMDGIASVLLGEGPLTNTEEEEDMAEAKNIWDLLFNGAYPPGVSPTFGGGTDRAEIFKRMQTITSLLTTANANLATLAGKDFVDEAAIAEGAADAVMARLAEGSDSEVLQRLAAALRPDRVRRLAALVEQGNA